MESSAPILIIGYGNELRGDDAAGPRVAASLEGLGLAGGRVLIRHQLTPELAEPIAGARAAIFVDAAWNAESEEVMVKPLHPGPRAGVSAHTADPRGLLALAEILYGRSPPAWLVTIPGRDFDLGKPLSPVAARGVEVAVVRVRELLRDAQSARK